MNVCESKMWNKERKCTREIIVGRINGSGAFVVVVVAKGEEEGDHRLLLLEAKLKNWALL